MQTQTLQPYSQIPPRSGYGVDANSGSLNGSSGLSGNTGAGGDRLSRVLASAYNRMSDRIATSLPAGTSGDASAKPASSADDFSPEAVTDRIMGFITDRLRQEKANGASDSRIQDLYNQALKGVESGLREAKNIMQGSGTFSGEIKNNFDNTVNMIADQLQSLGKSLFQTPATTPDSIQTSSQSIAVGQSRSFSMQVVTQDGDRVTLNVASGQSLSQQFTEFSEQNIQANNTGSTYSSYDHFAFQVEGELDEGEMNALQDLFKQVNSVAETFYNGDVEKAFNQALEVGMDVNELSAFAVDLTRSETSVVQNTYTRINNLDNISGRQPVRNPLAGLGDFTNQVNQARDAVRSLMSDLPNAHELLGGLLNSLQSSDASQQSVQAFNNWIGGTS